MSNQLELRNVAVNYGAFTAAQDVSLTLEHGQIGCLLGPSGCGKTTLLRAIAGFEPVSKGEIVLQGEVISSPAATLAPERRRVGMVFQDFALFPHLNVEDNIAFGLGGLDRRGRRQRVAQLLEWVDLGHQAKAYPHQLSGGQQQRVALARALAPEPGILLLDEPFSSLDSELREQLAGEVRQLLKRSGVTAILVTHDQHEAFAMADRVTLLQEGRVAQSDTPYNLYHNPASEFVARFIGQGALVTVQVGESGELSHGLASIEGRGLPWQAGDRLRLLVRPDDIQYAAHSPLQLRVTDRAFRGAQYLYELELPDGQRIPCLAPSHVDLPAGSMMPVMFRLKHVVVFNGVNQPGGG